MGPDAPLFNTIHRILDDSDYTASSPQKPVSGANSYVRDARAMAPTPADVIEHPTSYQFIIDMPGIKSENVKVQLEDKNVLVISGERKRDDDEKVGVKYLRIETRFGKFMRKFVLPDNANMEAIKAFYQHGVLTVIVDKLPPPQPNKPRTI